MTLIELIIAVAVLGVIIVPLVGAMMLSLSTNQATAQRVSDSSGSQLAASWFVPDVQGADTVETPGGLACGGANTLLELGWTDADPTVATTTHVTYDDVPPTGASGDYQLVRSVFSMNGASCTLTSESTVVHETVAPNDPTNPPLVTCAPGPCGPATRDISLRITALTKQTTGNSYSPYTFQLSATRRVAS